jgi:hypothetical protein
MGAGVFPSPPQKFLIFSYGYGAFWRIFIMDSKLENSQVSQNSIVGINGENGASPA